VFQSTFGIQVLNAKNESKLVFNKYGDQYFLEQIWLSGQQEGTQVPESRSERTIRQQLSQTQQSNLSGKVTKVDKVEIVAGLF
jgi:frataxin-like iron-binding protein CyaY